MVLKYQPAGAVKSND